MKTFKPGDYVRLENEKTPAMIELLRVNGWSIWEGQTPFFYTNDDCILFSNEHDFFSCFFDSNSDFKTELSRHDFMVTSLQLNEGDGMRSDMSAPEQRKHIVETLIRFGINYQVLHGIEVLSTYGFNLGVEDELWAIHDDRINHIPYTEWCRRLNIEPIHGECEKQCGMNYCDENGCSNRKRVLVEPSDHLTDAGKTIILPDGTTVDLTKPIEVSDDGIDWEEKEEFNLIEVTLKGHAILEFDDVFYAYKFIRNKP